MEDKTIKINLIVGVILSLLFVLFSFTGISLLERFELGIYDFGSVLARDDNLDPARIVIVEIDDKSLDKLGSWPWPRRIMAEMIDLLKESGALIIGLNIPLDEAEHDEGLEEIREFHDKYDAYPAASADMSLKRWVLASLEQIEGRIDNDSILQNSIKKAGNVILPVYESVPPGVKKTDDESSFLFRYALDASGISSRVKASVSRNEMRLPLPAFGENASGVGLVAASPASGDSGCSYPAFIGYKGSIIPSFSLSIAASYLGLTPGDIKVEDDIIRLKNLSVPLTEGEMLIKYGYEIKRYSFADFVDAEVIPENVFKGKIVLIGFNDSRSGIPDIPGIRTETELNAGLLDNIINSGAVSRPSLMPYIEAVMILIAGIAAMYIASLQGRKARSASASAAFLLILAAGVLSLAVLGIWFKTVYIAGCLVSVYLVLVLRDFFASGLFRRETPEEARVLGMDYQARGLLDLAFRKFQSLPHDDESMDLIYKIGLEYEKKNNLDKALEVYEYLSGLGGYKDIEDHIAGLKLSDESAITGHYERIKEKDSDSGERVRKGHVGRYEIIEILGKGSMGLVYKAQDPKINRPVAIKTMRFSDEFEEDLIQEIKERFFREAEIAGRLSHPSIVTIHDVGEDGDLTYMAMEFLEGQDLDKFITKRSLLPFRRVLDVIAKTAEALDYAHKTNVIHRDIKPANIMLLKNGNIKVTDFGIAKAISSSRTKTGVILGTPNYMSPEQIMGQKVDPRSDIFSLGVVFYQMITGELPFHGENLSALLYQITQIKHPSPRSYNQKLPAVCEQILDKALAKDPNKRFRTAGEMARVINALGQRIDQIRIEKSSIK
ncbi:MAG: protein kinase [Deltaproteobacteria bacterium]|nr:protein kinase [Deltaproteobacteria bacterium]